MSKSIIEGNESLKCHCCGRWVGAPHKHHIFGGANRKFSEAYGLWVYLCPTCHNIGNHGVHQDKELMKKYHEIGQRAFEADCMKRKAFDHEQARAEFMRIFGRNYL